jgi:Cdc25 family phosphatase
VAVLDCRDDDFAGGNIRGAINLPAEAFYGDSSAVDELIDTLAGKSRVVVHCFLSQQRGPRCAARLAQRLQERGLTQQVLVMSGGWQRFSRLYGSDPQLVEGQHGTGTA